jgi:putative peptide zinc metalloprotease protein
MAESNSENLPKLSPIDPMQQWLGVRLSVRSELRFDVRDRGKDPHVVIEDPVRNKFFQIGLDEFRLTKSLDGKSTIEELIEKYAAADPETKFDQTRLINVCQWLTQNNLVYGDSLDNTQRLDMQANLLKRARMMSWLNPISIKCKLFNPDQLLKRIQPSTQWMFSGWVFVVWTLTGIYAASILWTDWDKLGGASTGIFAGNAWIWLLLIWILLKVLHETAHGIACRRFGGDVPEAGVLLLLFTPLAYVNVTSMWRFGNRWHRIVVASAGMYVELFVSFISIILWQRFPGVIGDIAFDVFIMSSVTTILFNANPLMRFDGYFILSDLIGVPNLYTKGTKWFSDRLKSIYFGVPKTPGLFAAGEFWAVAIYGTLAFFWKFLICFSLMIAASVLFYGAGIVLAAAAGILWFGIPVVQQVRAFFGPKAVHSVDKARLATSLALTAVAGVLLFFVIEAPATKSAPAIVQFSEEQILRAKADGFIREILVDNGQAVVRGQPLLVLENRELTLEVFELEKRASEARIQSRIHVQSNELALAQTSAEKYESLVEQLAEKQSQIDGLTVRAPIDGFVYQRDLSNRIDSFAKRGDPLFSIAEASTKEIVVSIDQRDLDSIEMNDGQDLRLAFPGMPIFASRQAKVNPKASIEPSHISLCAHAGGPLAVKPASRASNSGDPKFELLDPRITVDVELSPEYGSRLQSGQRGRAFFETRRQSLGSYVIVVATDWLENKIEMATQAAVF